jgi:DNA segregation ATPase FtsK/SpoIIIE-like protein
MSEINITFLTAIILFSVIATVVATNVYLKKKHQEIFREYKTELKKSLILTAFNISYHQLESLFTYYRHQYSTDSLAEEYATEELGMTDEEFRLWNIVKDEYLIRFSLTSHGIDEDFADLIDFIREKMYFLKYGETIDDTKKKLGLDKPHESSSKSTESNEFKQLMKRATVITNKNTQVSSALFQRLLSIDYKTAKRIIDELERRGDVDAADGARPRNVIKH